MDRRAGKIDESNRIENRSDNEYSEDDSFYQKHVKTPKMKRLDRP